MLPGYISYYLGASYKRKATTGGTVCLLGLLLTFSIIGLIASLFSSLMGAYVHVLELIAGVVTLFMGVVLLTNLELPQVPIPAKAPKQKGFAGLFVYGVLYGLVTISCSAPIFFSILVFAISNGPLEAFISFVAYALGMGLPLISITVILEKAKDTILGRIIELTPAIQRLAGLVLIIVGGYLVAYYFFA